MINSNVQPTFIGSPIRNSRIKRDFKRLLAIIADAREPDYSEVERIANRHGLYFDEKGEVRESQTNISKEVIR